MHSGSLESPDDLRGLTAMWIYRTDIGVFSIRFDPRTRTRFLLGIGEEPLGWFFSPEAAADVVFLQDTGWSVWDSHSTITRPRDLNDWIRLDCQS